MPAVTEPKDPSASTWDPDLDADATYGCFTGSQLDSQTTKREQERGKRNRIRMNVFKAKQEMAKEELNVRGRVGGARRRSASHVPVRAGVYEYEEPLSEIHYDVGFNCVVPIYVGGQPLRMCVDTGGGR